MKVHRIEKLIYEVKEDTVKVKKALALFCGVSTDTVRLWILSPEKDIKKAYLHAIVLFFQEKGLAIKSTEDLFEEVETSVSK